MTTFCDKAMETMKTQFFEQYGNEIEFKNDSDVNEKFSSIDCSVPKKTQGRTSDHKERFCIKIYLMALCLNKLLRFPLRIKKSEAPDFLILSNNQTIALEVTEATTEDFQCADTELEKSPEGTMLENSFLKFENSSLPKGEYKKALRKPGEKLIGDAWVGDSLEREWVNIIISAIDKKIHKLNEPHFKTANRYELLIYESQVVGLVIDKALPLLNDAIHKKFHLASFERNFDSISVIYNDQLLYDIAKKK